MTKPKKSRRGRKRRRKRRKRRKSPSKVVKMLLRISRKYLPLSPSLLISGKSMRDSVRSSRRTRALERSSRDSSSVTSNSTY